MLKPENLKLFKESLCRDIHPISEKVRSRNLSLEEYITTSSFNDLGRVIKHTLGIIEGWWNEQQEIRYHIKRNGKNHPKVAEFYFNTSFKQIGKNILKGDITIRTFNAVFCFYLYNFLQLVKEEKKNKKHLIELKEFIELFIPQNSEQAPMISALINNAFSSNVIAKSWKITVRINKKWKCEFYDQKGELADLSSENGQSGKTKPSIEKVNDGVIDSNNGRQQIFKDENLSTYFQVLIKDFSKIKLSSVGFEIPIKSFIQLPLFKSGHKLKKQKERLVDVLDKKPKNKEEIEQELQKVNSILERKNDIFDVLSQGEDIFIEAPAGMGKSTTIKWLIYQICSNGINPQILPVYIELKYFSAKEKTLFQEIIELLEDYNLNYDSKDQKLIVFLDGFDEYNGGHIDFSKNLKELKRKIPDCQIVMSGRSEPIFSDNNIEFIIYTILHLQENHTRQLFIDYLVDSGAYYFDYFQNKDLLKYINTPLYTVFVLVFIKYNRKTNPEEIEKIITNKPLLFKSLLIDNFIGGYEVDKLDPKDENEKKKFQLRKTNEIKAISALAYHMSFNLNSELSIELDYASSYIDKSNSLKKLILNSTGLIDSFTNHGILVLKKRKERTLLSFSNAEIQLFLTAFYLSENISSSKEYFKYQKEFAKIDNQLKNNYWENISEFVLGIIQPEKLINSKKFRITNDRLLLTNSVAREFELLVRLADKKNISNLNILNRDILKNIISNTLTDYKEFDQIKKIPDGILLFTAPLVILIKPILFWFRRIPLSIIRITNGYFLFSHNLSKRYNYLFFTKMILLYRMDIPFDKVITIAKSYRDYVGEKVLKNIIEEESGFPALSKNECIELMIYKAIRDDRYKGYKLLIEDRWGAGTSTRFLIQKKLRLYSKDFIEKLLALKPLSHFTIYRIYNFLKNHHGHPMFKFDTEKIDKDDREYLQDILISAIVDFKRINPNISRHIHRLLNEGLDKEFTEELLERLKNEYLLNDETVTYKRINAVIFLFMLGGKESQKLIHQAVLDSSHNLNDIVKQGLKKCYFPSINNTNKWGTHVSELMLDYIDFNLMSVDEIKAFISGLYRTNQELRNLIAKYITKKPNEELDHVCLTFFLGNPTKSAVNWLVSKLDDLYYRSYAYYILSEVSVEYFFKYKEKLDFEYTLAMVRLEDYLEDINYDFDMNNLRRVLYLCDKHMLVLLDKVMNSRLHFEKLTKLHSGVRGILSEIHVRVEEQNKYLEKNTS